MKVTKRITKKMCNAKACPDVLQAADGDYLVIGEDVSANYNCVNGESVVRVPKNVFESREN